MSLPEYDETVECDNPNCVHIGAKPLTGLYGMMGGGMGPYTVCEACGVVLTKSQDAELFDSHEVEIKDGRENSKANPDNQNAEGDDKPDEQSGGTVPSPRE